MNYPLKRLARGQRGTWAGIHRGICLTNRTLLVLVALFAFALTSISRADAATITVCASGCDQTTIQAAINAASAGDTISITDALHTEANITVNKNLTIEGQGAANTTIDGGAAGSVFIIESGVTATLSDMTIQDGNAANGGGVYDGGHLRVDNCMIQNNSATHSGGGIYNIDAKATVTNCTFSGNSAFNGGGIATSRGGALAISGSTFSGNSASDGGAIYSNSIYTLTATNSTFSDNSATYDGGGIWSYYGVLTATNSTFSGNSATNDGGGIFNLFNTKLTATNSTFSGNSAAIDGGGIDSYQSTATVTNSTFSGNTATDGGGIGNEAGAVAYVKSSILASQPSGSGEVGGNCYNDNTSTTQDEGYNISDDTTCGFSITNNSVSGYTGSLLSSAGLAENGGPTESIALDTSNSSNPAIDAIQPTDCIYPSSLLTDPCLATGSIADQLTCDQRGYARPDGSESYCDIGAYESGATATGAKFQIDTSTGSFDLKSSITFAGAIDPVTQNVALQVGSYSVTIPAGSFVETKKGDYVFEGTIGGVSLQVRLVTKGEGVFMLQAEGSNADLSGTTNPLAVGLTTTDANGNLLATGGISASASIN